MTERTLAVALTAALCGLVVAPALAQNAAPAPTKLKAKDDRERKSTVTVMVTNSRKADLVQLQAAESGSVELEESARAR